MRTNIAREIQQALVDDHAARDRRLFDLVHNDLDASAYATLWREANTAIGMIRWHMPLLATHRMKRHRGYAHRKGSGRWPFWPPTLVSISVKQKTHRSSADGMNAPINDGKI